MICLSHKSNRCFLYLIRPVRLSIIYLRRNYLAVQSWGMSNWQMTQNSDIAYAPWDFNSLATLLFVKQIVQGNMKENIKLTFCEGNPPAMESPHTGPPKLHSSHPLQRECSGDQWFHRTQDQSCHQLRNDKLHNSSIIWFSWVSDSHLHCWFNSLFGQTWKETTKLHFFCEEEPPGTNGDTTNWASNAETCNQALTLHQQCEKH